MSKIDLGFLNRKQLNILIDTVVQSEVDIIAIQIIKAVKKMSVVLKFKSNKDKDRFDARGYKVVQDLKRLRGE